MNYINFCKSLVCPRSNLCIREDLEVLNGLKIDTDGMTQLVAGGFSPHWLLDCEYDECDGYDHLSISGEKSILKLARLEQASVTLKIISDWEDAFTKRLFKATVKRYSSHYVIDNITLLDYQVASI